MGGSSMDAYRVIGGRSLRGTVRASGSKNTALPLMAASLLADGPVQLDRVPQVADVSTLAAVLGQLGVAVDRQEPNRLRLTSDHAADCVAPAHYVSRMRASFCVLGPLLARRGRAVVALPGGCNLGDRPVDLHLQGLAALGADIRIQQGYVVAEVPRRGRQLARLNGARVDMTGSHGPTVTGTANVMMAATLARGTTQVNGAACEPDVVELGRFLIRLGADIEGLGTSTIVIRGVDRLVATKYETPPDRVEAATLLISAAITGGEVTVRDVCTEQLAAVLDVLAAAGADVSSDATSVTLRASKRLNGLQCTAQPYPGVPTDLQPLLLALACTSTGRSTITDQVFPGRWRHVAELRRLGAKIRVSGHTAHVTDVDRLNGARVKASDLRAGAALVLAGLAAHGETIVTQVGHLDRGYERWEHKLRTLGADIERVVVSRSRPAATQATNRC